MLNDRCLGSMRFGSSGCSPFYRFAAPTLEDLVFAGEG